MRFSASVALCLVVLQWKIPGIAEHWGRGRTDEEGKFLWREAKERGWEDGSGADFCCRLFSMEEYFFCF